MTQIGGRTRRLLRRVSNKEWGMDYELGALMQMLSERDKSSTALLYITAARVILQHTILKITVGKESLKPFRDTSGKNATKSCIFTGAERASLTATKVSTNTSNTSLATNPHARSMSSDTSSVC